MRVIRIKKNLISGLLTRKEIVKENFRVINVVGNNILNVCFQNNLSWYRISSTHNQSLVAHIMSKISFMKYLAPIRPKLVSKLKMLRIYWNLTHLIFQTCRYRFWCRKRFLLNIYCWLVPKWKMLIIHWNLAH